ncbi:MAG: C39 family peptidase [Oscillospiraceae bacterium]|nr:C39 family peptidase [Oscillospiraceae bacterium]
MTEPTYTPPVQPPQRRPQRRPRRSRYTLKYLAPTLIFLAALLLIVILVVVIVSGVKDNTGDATTGSSQASTGTSESTETSETETGTGAESETGSSLPELSLEEKKQFILTSALYNERMQKMVVDFPQTIDYVYRLPELDGTKQETDLSSLADSEEVPLLLQFDDRWGYLPYGSGHIGYTGCGPVCLSMVAIYLTGDTSYTPEWMCNFATEEGYCSPGNGTAWTLFSQGAEKLGLTAKELPLVKGLITNELDKGNPVVIVVGPGDFTNTGHFLVLTGYDETGFTINDPFSVENSNRTWSYSQLEPQILNLWSLKKAEEKPQDQTEQTEQTQ